MTPTRRVLALAAALAAGCTPKDGPRPNPDTSGPTPEQATAITRERLDRIGQAVRDKLPWMYYARATGAPGLSWRVDLLQYLGEEALYKEFKLDERWDSEHNQKLIGRMPEVFKSPRGQAPDGHTYLRTFVGPRAVFPPSLPAGRVAGQFKENSALQARPYFPRSPVGGTDVISDGAVQTLFCAEAGEAVPWTKPDELAYEAGRPVPKLGGVYDDGFFAVSAAGAVVFVPAGTPEPVVRALITANAGEPITDKGILDQLNAPFPALRDPPMGGKP